MNPNRIESLDNKKIKDACRLKDGKDSRFLVEGHHLVEMALSSGLTETVFSIDEDEFAVSSYLVSPIVLKKLCSTVTPEGIVAVVKKKEAYDLSCSRVLFLDSINDPGNMGTLLRSALSFGFKDVILSKGCASPYSSKSLLASQGAIFFLNIIELKDDSVDYLVKAKEKGYSSLATELPASLPLKEVPRDLEKLILILGNEARGVSKEILSISDMRMRIEMEGIDSLNVGVAGGIAMYELKEE